MGYIKHNAIVVTSWDEKLLTQAHEKAQSMGLAVSAKVPSKVNGYGSFIVAPDGSNERFADSEAGDGLRAAFRRWLSEQCHEDGSSSLEWCEVEYGSDPGSATVVASQWAQCSEIVCHVCTGSGEYVLRNYLYKNSK